MLQDQNLILVIHCNYDDFIFNALESRNKHPKREYCRWSDEVNNYLENVEKITTVFDSSYTIYPDYPLVYHLHGHMNTPQSMVLTENDYLDFMLRLHDKVIHYYPHKLLSNYQKVHYCLWATAWLIGILECYLEACSIL